MYSPNGMCSDSMMFCGAFGHHRGQPVTQLVMMMWRLARLLRILRLASLIKNRIYINMFWMVNIIGNWYGIVFYFKSRSLFGFCLIWALGGSDIGQKNGGRLTKILPARQTYFGGSLASPSGKTHFRTKTHHTNKSVILIKNNHCPSFCSFS